MYIFIHLSYHFILTFPLYKEILFANETFLLRMEQSLQSDSFWIPINFPEIFKALKTGLGTIWWLCMFHIQINALIDWWKIKENFVFHRHFLFGHIYLAYIHIDLSIDN